MGEFLFRIRSYTGIPFFLIAFLFFPSDIPSFLMGIISILIGESIRIWSVSYAGLTTRAREIMAPYLVREGPYAYIRHPIYLGNFFIGIGFLLCLSRINIPLLILFSFLFWVVYYLITSAEEKFLEKKFPEYKEYQKRVPRFFPYKGKASFPSQVKPNIKMALRSERDTFFLILGVLLLGGAKLYTGFYIKGFL